jgi:hypothetical protein
MLPLHDFEATLAKLWSRIDAIPAALVDVKPRPEDWSAKEIVCHLVDSASNNHQRFTRLQRNARLEFPAYESEPWVMVEKPAAVPWSSLVALLKAYNDFVLHLVRSVDPACLGHVWVVDGKELSLEYLMGDYYRHLEWHIAHLDKRLLEVAALLPPPSPTSG